MGLFFVMIVVVPVALIAALVVEVTRDSQEGKADASLSTGLDTTLALYEELVTEAKGALPGIAMRPDVRASLERGNPTAVVRAAKAQGQRAGLGYLRVRVGDLDEVALGSGEAFASSILRTSDGSLELEGSLASATEFAEGASAITGLDVALEAGGLPTAATLDTEGFTAPDSGSAVDADLGGVQMRAASGDLPGEQEAQVTVFAEREPGGFFDSSPRVVAALALFLLIAVGLILFVLRTLQGQVGAMLAAARRIGSGDFSSRVPVVGRDEMAGLADEFNKMSERLEEQVAQLRRQRTELDRSINRLGEAFASGLDRNALLTIVAETAVSACDAELGRVRLAGDVTVIEVPSRVRGPARDAAIAGEKRSERDGSPVAARREDGHSLSAPLRLLSRPEEQAGTISIARRGKPFEESERAVFLYLLGQASVSIENIAAHERASEQAVTDELTGLPNSRAFRETIEREAARAERFGHELSLVILDLDDFKTVNDTHGHLQGDAVLKVIGEILSTEPRAIDEPGRYGGEEFVVALPETGIDGAVELAERVRARLEGEAIPMADGSGKLRVTASFGAASMPTSAADVRDLFSAADDALYEAKRSGKNRVATAPELTGEKSQGDLAARRR